MGNVLFVWTAAYQTCLMRACVPRLLSGLYQLFHICLIKHVFAVWLLASKLACLVTKQCLMVFGRQGFIQLIQNTTYKASIQNLWRFFRHPDLRPTNSAKGTQCGHHVTAHQPWPPPGTIQQWAADRHGWHSLFQSITMRNANQMEMMSNFLYVVLSANLWNIRTSKHTKTDGLWNSVILHSTEATNIETRDWENIG